MMRARRIEKLLVTDGAGKLTGLLTLKDTEQAVLNPTACKDESRPTCALLLPRSVGDSGLCPFRSS